MAASRSETPEQRDHLLCPLCMAQRLLRRLDLGLDRHRQGRLGTERRSTCEPTDRALAHGAEFRRISEPHRTRLLTLLHDLEAEIAAEDTVPAAPVPTESLIDPDLVSNPVGSRHDLRRALAHLERRRLQIDPDVFMSLGGGRRASDRLRRRVERDATAGRIELID